MSTKKLVWRLKEQPSSESLRQLVTDGLLTKEEAREMLFSSETEEDRDKKSLESEIKFLRSLVDQLSKNNNTRIVEVVKEIQVPYSKWNWYKPYEVWCTNTTQDFKDTNTVFCNSGNGNKLNASATLNTMSKAFSDIETF